MRRASSAYRLQLIKEAALKTQGVRPNDPMANYIHHLMEERPDVDKAAENTSRYNGLHFDEQAGGWVSDMWDGNK
ncbi:hypothetical protein [Vibrio sp. WXL103]|uniref:hypothetical protein n=1 Tax=unclassified Vibrio TaxID=2614977 RepID=UPI003EC66108